LFVEKKIKHLHTNVLTYVHTLGILELSKSWKGGKKLSVNPKARIVADVEPDVKQMLLDLVDVQKKKDAKANATSVLVEIIKKEHKKLKGAGK
jgi:hypothetical protein